MEPSESDLSRSLGWLERLGGWRVIGIIGCVAVVAGVGGWLVGLSQGENSAPVLAPSGRLGTVQATERSSRVSEPARAGAAAKHTDDDAATTLEDLIRGAWITEKGAFSFHDGRYRASFHGGNWDAGVYGFSGGQLYTKAMNGDVMIIKYKFGLDENNVPTMSWDTSGFDKRTSRYVPLKMEFLLAGRDRKVKMPSAEAERIAETGKPPYRMGYDLLFDKKAQEELNPYAAVSAAALDRMKRGDYSGTAGMAFIAGQVGVLGHQEMINHAERHETLRSLRLIDDVPYDPEPLHKPARKPRLPRD